MKSLLCTLLLLAAGLASADTLGEANKLRAAKSFDQAMPLYASLANAGNPEAQLRLGEMYWDGDGAVVDMAKAAYWIEQSAAAGNPEAKATLAALKRRDTRGAEITWWTTTYAGEDLSAGKFACARPAIPLLSKTNDNIRTVGAAVTAWEQCYNGFVANLNDAMPPGKRIPGDVQDMMSRREIEQARAHLDSVYAKVAASAQADAAGIVAQRDAWRAATAKHVAAQNETIAARSKELEAEIARRKQENDNRPKSTAPYHLLSH